MGKSHSSEVSAFADMKMNIVQRPTLYAINRPDYRDDTRDREEFICLKMKGLLNICQQLQIMVHNVQIGNRK